MSQRIVYALWVIILAALPASAADEVEGTFTVKGATTVMKNVYATLEKDPGDPAREYLVLLVSDQAIVEADRTPVRLTELARRGALRALRIIWGLPSGGRKGLHWTVPYHSDVQESGRRLAGHGILGMSLYDGQRVHGSMKSKNGQDWHLAPQVAVGGINQSASATNVPRETGGQPMAPAATDGAGSVEAVVKQMQTAAAAGQARELLAVIYPDDRAAFAQNVAVIVSLPVHDPQASEKVKKDIAALFAKHKIQEPLSRDDAAELFKGTDLTTFLTDAMTFLKGQLKKGETLAGALPMPNPNEKLQDVKVTGDSAVAKLDRMDVTFRGVSGRWFIRLYQ